MENTSWSRVRSFVSKYWSWGLLLLAGFYLYNRVSPDIDVSNSAEAAPDFELTTMDGDAFRLSNQRGDVLVLNFWATWCPPCRAEIPGFIDLQEEYRDAGVSFVGVSLDEEGFDVVRPYAENRGINYTLVADRGEVSHLYGGIETVPTTFLIDREGRIRYRHEGLLLEGALRNALEELVAE